MHRDVEALLAVQVDDARIHSVEDRLAELAPRIERMTREREREVAALARAQQALDAEDRRRRDFETRLAHHKQLQARSETQLNAITSSREATAAMAQAEQTRRMVADVQHEVDSSAHRLAELRQAVEERESAIAELDRAQAEARASLDADRAALEAELSEVRADRAKRAVAVPRALLARYDRIQQKRRSTVVFPLRGGSCANCDTVIPLQRRAAMVSSGVTEVCEECGMILYAGE